jgi:hypothetical protein
MGSYRGGSADRLYGCGHIRPRQPPIDGQTLLRCMAAEQLQLRTDDTLLGQIGDELVPEEVRIDPLGKRVTRVFTRLVAPPSGGVTARPVRCCPGACTHVRPGPR